MLIKIQTAQKYPLAENEFPFYSPRRSLRPFPALTVSIYVLGYVLLCCDQQVAAHHCVKGTQKRRRLES